MVQEKKYWLYLTPFTYDESSLIVSDSFRFPSGYFVATSVGPTATLLSSIYDAASWIQDSDDTNNVLSNAQLSFRKNLERLLKVTSNPKSDLARAHMVWSRGPFKLNMFCVG